MRFLKWTAIVLAILATGVWFAASFVVQNGAESFFANLAKQGRVAAAPGLSVGGFPTRMDLAMTGVKFLDPQTGEGWELPELHLSVPSWKPWHLTAELPASQTLTLTAESVPQEITVTSDGLAASVRVSPDIAVGLQEITAGGAALEAVSSLGWTVGAADLRARLLIDANDSRTYALTLDGRDIAPDASLARALAAVSLPDLPDLPVSDLPAKVESLTLAMQLHLTEPLHLTSAALNPQLTGLELQEMTAVWGPLKIAATGNLAGDAAGFAAGRIEIEITNWNRLPPLLAATGAVQPGVVTLISNGMKALAEEGGDPAVLKVPLIMADGRATLGPFPLGEAPRMARGPGS